MIEQLKEFGTAYIVVMIMVAVVFIMDAVSIVRCLVYRRDELTDYAEFIIKYAKIFMLIGVGAYLILQTLDDKILPSVKALHIILGVLAVIDGGVSLFVKLKYRYERINGKANIPKDKYRD